MGTFTIRLKNAFNGFSFAIDNEKGQTEFEDYDCAYDTRKEAIKNARQYIAEVLDCKKAKDLEGFVLVTRPADIEDILSQTPRVEKQNDYAALLVKIDGCEYAEVYGSFTAIPLDDTKFWNLKEPKIKIGRIRK